MKKEEKRVFYRYCWYCGKRLVTCNPYQRVHKRCRAGWYSKGKGEHRVSTHLVGYERRKKAHE